MQAATDEEAEIKSIQSAAIIKAAPGRSVSFGAGFRHFSI